MSANELETKCRELKELEELQQELTAEMDALKDAIKQELQAQDVEELTCGQYIVRWTTTISNRLDTSSLKKQLPDLYKSFLKQSTSRRFSVSA